MARTETADGARTACWLKRGQGCASPETETAKEALTSRRLLFFFFSQAALSPSVVHTLPHISVITITIPVPLTFVLSSSPSSILSFFPPPNIFLFKRQADVPLP